MKNESIVNGVVYGFVLSFVFLLAEYSGKASLISRVPFFAVLGVFGGVCGLVLGLLGFSVKTRLTAGRKKR
jgi:H+/Cl- antiporter ClcA